jgi:hypothetical protein
VVSEDTVAFSVERAATSGAMTFPFWPDAAPEFVTAWHTPPETPSHEPSLCEPRGSGDTDGSVAVAALDTLPVQTAWPSQTMAAPATEAADGPAGIRATLTCWALPCACGPEKASAAPGPVEAPDADWIWQPPVPPVQLAVPSEVRGFPPATPPSQAAVLVCTEPEQGTPGWQARLALDDEVDEGPLSD